MSRRSSSNDIETADGATSGRTSASRASSDSLAEAAPVPPTPAKPANGKLARGKWTGRALLIALGVVALTWGVLHWRERPLAEAERALALGQHQRALSLASYYLASHGDNGRALAVKAQALVELGQASEAIATFEKCGVANFEETHAWAKAYLLNQQWSRALPILKRAHAERPRDPDVLHELTTCRIRLGLLSEAQESASLLTEIPGQEARGWVMQATIYNDLGDYLHSLESYAKTLEYSPDATGLQLTPDDIFLQYGMALLNSGHPAEALKMFQRSLALRPSTDAYAGLGNCQLLLGEAEAAKSSWAEAVKLGPHNVAARESLAKAALQERDYQAAQRWLLLHQEDSVPRSSTAFLMQRVLTLSGDKAGGDAWGQKAEALRKREQRASRIEELLLRSPYGYWSNAIRAHRFAQAGNWQQAQDMVRELAGDGNRDPFIRKLTEAIEKRAGLPSLDELPDSQY